MDPYVNFPSFQTNEADAPEPVDATDFKKDVAVIFWSSGTTGEILCLFCSFLSHSFSSLKFCHFKNLKRIRDNKQLGIHF
jgi:hypothetical protein